MRVGAHLSISHNCGVHSTKSLLHDLMRALFVHRVLGGVKEDLVVLEAEVVHLVGQSIVSPRGFVAVAIIRVRVSPGCSQRRRGSHPASNRYYVDLCRS